MLSILMVSPVRSPVTSLVPRHARWLFVWSSSFVDLPSAVKETAGEPPFMQFPRAGLVALHRGFGGAGLSIIYPVKQQRFRLIAKADTVQTARSS